MTGNRRSPGVSYEELVELALELPGVEVGTSYGTPALRVKKKFLARLREDGETLALRIPFEERDILLSADPKVFFITEHYENYPAVVVRLAVVRRGPLTDVLELAWRAQAPKRLVAAYDAERNEESGAA